jgi:hypothetical protein
MIFTNPAGAPELACDECGCRWFDRRTDSCYECGARVSGQAMEEFRVALERWGRSQSSGDTPSGFLEGGDSRVPGLPTKGRRT